MLKIRIQSKQNARDGQPVVEGLKPTDVKPIKDFTVGILEGGTVSGQTTLMFATQDEAGNTFIKEITGREFESLYGIYQSAQQRFINEKAKMN